MNNPLVSIITPVYNSKDYLKETLNSVLSQSYTNWEHILVDDGSLDQSIAIIESYIKKDVRFRLLKRDRLPKGRSTSRNIGIKEAKGKYIIFLDSDDILMPFCLEKRVGVFEENQQDNFIVFQMEMFLPNGEIRDNLCTIPSENYLYSFLSFSWVWQTSCPMWKVSFLHDNSFTFDEHLSNLEDPLLHTQSLLLDNKNFSVLYQQEYIDSQYRVDYKPVDLKNLINSSIYFVEKVFTEIKGREDNNLCKYSLNIAYTTLLNHYSGQSKKDIYSNITAMKNFNTIFVKYKLITKKQSLKTQMFLFLLSTRTFENKYFVKILNKFGFENFYCFTFNRF